MLRAFPSAPLYCKDASARETRKTDRETRHTDSKAQRSEFGWKPLETLTTNMEPSQNAQPLAANSHKGETATLISSLNEHIVPLLCLVGWRDRSRLWNIDSLVRPTKRALTWLRCIQTSWWHDWYSGDKPSSSRLISNARTSEEATPTGTWVVSRSRKHQTTHLGLPWAPTVRGPVALGAWRSGTYPRVYRRAAVRVLACVASWHR